jgi:putative flippase GtrA
MINEASNLSGHMKLFASFSFFGLVAAGIDFCIYLGLMRAGVNPILGNVLSSSIGILINYVLVSNFTFGVDFKNMQNLLLFFIIAIALLILSSLTLAFLINSMGVNALLAKVITLPISAVVKYAVNRRYTFNELSDQ